MREWQKAFAVTEHAIEDLKLRDGAVPKVLNLLFHCNAEICDLLSII